MIFDRVLDVFRGKAVTIPPMDGAFRPNTVLDDAAVALDLPAADNLVLYQGQVMASSGATLHTLDGSNVQSFAAPVAALAVAPDGTLAVALENGTLTVGGVAAALPPDVRCITDLAYGPDGGLWLANGSAQNGVSAWSADLMQKNASGSVWRYADGACHKIAGGLAWPYGLLPDAAGVVVSESWQHRLIHITPNGKTRTILHSLPGYPARMTPAKEGAWLALFAPRNRLIEFVLQETHYRAAMMAEVPRDLWIAPALASDRSFLEPLQCGGIKTMGVHKPWSPSRSYGLVVRLNTKSEPQFSLHSRANGRRHGVTSLLDHDGQLYVAAKGGDCVLSLKPEAL